MTASYVSAKDTWKPVAKGYVLIESTTGKVLAGENQHVKLPMASTTKIMTALLTVEQQELDTYFTVDSQAIKVEGTSMGLREGDSASLRTLAYGMMLPSGNDAANAAAVRISGSMNAFVEQMNLKAQELSMQDTHFVTPSGLHDDNHYSTAYDMALLARAAIRNPVFASICKKQKATVSFGNPPYSRSLTNHNKLLKEYDGCVGMKTGFTKKAGRCLVSVATRNDISLICVTLGASDDWNIHKRLFDYGFSHIEKTTLVSDTTMLLANVVGGEEDSVAILPHTNVTAPINEQEVSLLTQQVYLNRFYYAPVKQGDVLGEIHYFLDGNRVAVTTLVSAETVARKQITQKQKKSFWEKIKKYFHLS